MYILIQLTDTFMWRVANMKQTVLLFVTVRELNVPQIGTLQAF